MARIRFVAVFLVLVVALELLLLLEDVDRMVARPFSAVIAAIAGIVVRMLTHDAHTTGTVIAARCFAVDIHNGCNGLEAVLFAVAAIIAFPATIRQRAIGLAGAALSIELANVIRVVTLFWAGCYRRSWFDTLHLAIWQTAIFALTVGYFVLWTRYSRLRGQIS